MTARTWAGLAAAACLLSAVALEPPTLGAISEPAQWLLRPVALPFAWRNLAEATRAGDAAETFARARQILQLLPTWTDAWIVFAYRFAVESSGAVAATDRVADAHGRLQVALAWLESARSRAGRREVELLQAMALLPELAVRREPELEAVLRREGHGAAVLADGYLAAAERLSGSTAVREQRTFLTPMVAAGMLGSGDRRGAIAVLETGIARSADVRDAATAAEWAARLAEVLRNLQGEDVDLTAVRADLRMAPLLPHLR